MKIGTRSVLYGAHCFFIHPFFVALAWWKLYGFPRDPRLWVAFFVHDLGYWGKPNMDGPEGEEHPVRGAQVMGWLFDRGWFLARWLDSRFGMLPPGPHIDTWRSWTLLHSRFYAKRCGTTPSLLCVADKLAVALEPWWLYLPRVIATGEIREYMALVQQGREGAKYASFNIPSETERAWFNGVRSYLRRWVEEHKDGRADTWTPGGRVATDSTGVWR